MILKLFTWLAINSQQTQQTRIGNTTQNVILEPSTNENTTQNFFFFFFFV